MTTSRITITIDNGVLADLKDTAPSGEVSSFVVEAIRQRLQADPFLQLLDELDQIHGPTTEDDKRRGAQWWNKTRRQLSSMPEQ
jgi:hypothetical protein